MKSALRMFTAVASKVADQVITDYSTSFGAATRLLGARHRQHIRNVYALVRVADEIVDGVAAEAGLSIDDQMATLQRYIDEVERALASGYSPDLVIHAFATTARQCDISTELTMPFFESMASDIIRNSNPDGGASLSREEHAEYVYGSAEVVGLMCLRVFTRGMPMAPETRARLERGARQLGAAFQNVNFLRDLADDSERLGRHYLTHDAELTDETRSQWVATIRAQLSDAEAVIPMLPRDCRAAVRTAHAIFSDLTDRIAHVPAAELYQRRIRVPNPRKTVMAGSAILATAVERRS